MIKIDLSKVRKEEKRKVQFADFSKLKSVRVENLLKAKGEYYAGIILWIGLFALIGYYWKINEERNKLRTELSRLNAEKSNLQVQMSEILRERRLLEERVASLRKEIQEIEKSRDIILGLKSYYEHFNSGFTFYTSYIPRSSWISSYKQTLNPETQTLTTELEINSFDYQSIGNYGKAIERSSQKVALSNMERKVNPHGFEYYSIKLSAEKPLREVR